MVAEQGGVCAACRTDEPKHVDHDHQTGHVRGVLCFLCNQALGNVRDDVERLQRLIDYLGRSWAKLVNLQTFEPPFPIEYVGTRHAA